MIKNVGGDRFVKLDVVVEMGLFVVMIECLFEFDVEIVCFVV